MKYQRIANQYGAALIMVLGVLAVVSALAMQIVTVISQLSSQQSDSVNLQQRYWFARGAEELAILQSQKLIEENKMQELNTHYPIDQGVIDIQVIPLHNCFNLNSFSVQASIASNNREQVEQEIIEQLTAEDKDDKPLELVSGLALKRNQLTKLYELLELEESKAELLADRLIDWLDSDSEPTGYNGAESVFYAGLIPARLAVNSHLRLADEISQFAGLESLDLKKLLSSTCARPGDNRLAININQLNQESAHLLTAALLGQVDSITALQIIEQRPENGYPDLATFWQQPALANLEIDALLKNSLTVQSQYFTILVNLSYEQRTLNLKTVIYFDDKQQVSILSRQFGAVR